MSAKGKASSNTTLVTNREAEKSDAHKSEMKQIVLILLLIKNMSLPQLII